MQQQSVCFDYAWLIEIERSGMSILESSMVDESEDVPATSDKISCSPLRGHFATRDATVGRGGRCPHVDGDERLNTVASSMS